MTLELLEALDRHARSDGAKRAAAPVGGPSAESLTYAWLRDRTEALRLRLVDATGPGATTLLCYPNRPEYLAAYLGSLAAGRTVFPISPAASGAETVSAAERSGAAAAIVTGEAPPALRAAFQFVSPLPEISPSALLLTGPAWRERVAEGPAMLLQSSGTTSRPKIVRRDGRSLDAVSRAMVRACGFTQDDHVLAAVPMCHSYGVEHGLLAPIFAGCCVHVCENFIPPNVLGELRSGSITIFPGVPFMFEMLCRATDHPFPALRRVYSAGGPLPRATSDEFRERCGLRIGQIYGATEIGSVTFNDPDRAPFDPASVGTPMQGVDIRILDTEQPRVDEPLPAGSQGQIAITAPSMLCGYLDGETPPLLDGYYLTGDLGILNPRGELTLTGRLKLLVDIGGRKVNPSEVEAVLRQHPGVGACVVIPMRLSETVYRLKAVVTPSGPESALSAEGLRQFCRQRLSSYKVPRVFEMRDALPTSASGKVLRRLVETS